jgi:hypothetical protein
VHRRKIILACVGLILIGSVIIILWRSNNSSSLFPPVLEILRVESGSGVIDDSGVEMTMVTFRLINANPNPENMLFIKTAVTETRVSNHWINVEAKLDSFVSAGGNRSLGVFLAPYASDRCRMTVKYAVASIPFRAKLGQFFRGKLGRLAFRIPPSVWNWLQGGEMYTPSPPWKKVKLEAAIPPAAQPAK